MPLETTRVWKISASSTYIYTPPRLPGELVWRRSAEVDVVAVHVEEGVLGAVVVEIGREAERLVEGEGALHIACGNDGDDGSQAVIVWHGKVSG
jgi:hypothetical protein